MKTPHIEEKIKKFKDKFGVTYTGQETQDEWLRQAFTEVRQDTLDEAWSKVNYWIKHRGTCAVEFEAGDCDCGLADTIKALQDNK